MSANVIKFRNAQGHMGEIHMNGKDRGTMIVHGPSGTEESQVAVAHDEVVQLGRGKDGQPVKMRVSDIKKEMAGYAERRWQEAQALKRGDFDEIRRLGLESRLIQMRNVSVLMDLGISDVHQAAPLPNVALGYHNAEGIADVVSPVVPTAVPSAKYYTWNADDAFQGADGLAASAGADVTEISPRLSNTNFTASEFAVQVHIPTEVQAAADAPLRPYFQGTRRCLTAIAIAREIRVQAAIGNSGSYASAQVVDLTGDPTKKWNGGANANPVRDIQTLMENALMEPTGIAMSRSAKNWFSIAAAVQKFTFAKANAKPIPDAAQFAALLDLPPIHVGAMKKKGSGGYPYIWGNDVVLFRTPPGVPSDGMDAGSMYSFRWSGGATPDGEMQGGFLVRGFFDFKRGPRGGMTTLVVHNDADVTTSLLLGGVIKGAIQ